MIVGADFALRDRLLAHALARVVRRDLGERLQMTLRFARYRQIKLSIRHLEHSHPAANFSCRNTKDIG